MKNKNMKNKKLTLRQLHHQKIFDLTKFIVTSRLKWWIMKLQFWKYKEIMEGVMYVKL